MRTTKVVITQYVLDESKDKLTAVAISDWIHSLDMAGVNLEALRLSEVEGHLALIGTQTRYYDDSTLARMEK